MIEGGGGLISFVVWPFINEYKWSFSSFIKKEKMSDDLKTNVCCLDLNQDCISYFKSLDLNVYEGSLGSVFSINWAGASYGIKPIVSDVNIPNNLHEYHVFVHDMENPKRKEYKNIEHRINSIESASDRFLVCCHPVTTYDLRPFGLYKLSNGQLSSRPAKRIDIVFVGREVEVEYSSATVRSYSPESMETISNLEGWNLVYGVEKYGNRVGLEDNNASKQLFEGKLRAVEYYRVFKLPKVLEDDKRVSDDSYLSLLKNEDGDCVSYAYSPTNDYALFVLPQAKDKGAVLKALFENVLFPYYSDFFPDIEARNWIHREDYQLPEEREIRRKMETVRMAYEQEMLRLERQSEKVEETVCFLKALITESGAKLVAAVKTFLEWLGFKDVVDKDVTLGEGDLKEEDLCFDYKDHYFLLEVKGINGTSTDAECSQIDKIVFRRIRQQRATNVHGVYIVNSQKNVEPLKRQTPPFKETQIKDAENYERTMIYTPQLFALYSDIENGYISKEAARECFLHIGLVDFQSGLISLGIPYHYYQNDTVVCLGLNGVLVSVGDSLFYKDEIGRLVGCKVESIEQENTRIQASSSGKIGIKLDCKVPQNREMFIFSRGKNSENA